MTVTIGGLRVINFEVSQREGEAAILECEVANPGLGALSLIGDVELLGAGVPFKGSVNSMPSDVAGFRTTVEFIAQPEDLPGALKAYANTLRTLPYYDPLFFGGARDWGGTDEDGNEIEDGRDPAEVLEARSAHFLIDPYTHAISLSDVLEGGSHIDLDVYDAASLKATISDTVINDLTAELSVEWDQSAVGRVNISGRVTGGARWTLTPPRSIARQGEIGGSSGWSVSSGFVSFTEGDTPRAYRTGSWEERKIVRRGPDGKVAETKTIRKHARAPIKRYHYSFGSMWAEYDYSQARRETVSLRMKSDAQPVFGEDQREESLSAFSLSSVTEDTITRKWRPLTAYAPGDVAQFSGRTWQCSVAHTSGEEFSEFGEDERDWSYVRTYSKMGTPNGSTAVLVGPEPARYWTERPGLSQAAMPDARTASYLDTGRGRMSLRHLVLRMRAYLRRRMRALNVTFRGRWEELAGVTLDHSITIRHRMFEGGEATGKVVAYRKVWKGEDGERTRYVEVTLGISVGRGTELVMPEPEDGEAYSAAFETGYAGGGADTYTFEQDGVGGVLSGPAVEHVVDVYRLNDPAYAVTSVVWQNDEAWQTAMANVADDILRDQLNFNQPLGETAVDAVNHWPTSVKFTMRRLHSGGVLERRMKCAAGTAPAPRGISL